MHGQRLDVETHIITTAVTSVQNVMKCVRSVGVEVDDLVLEPLASSEAVLTEEEKQNGVILADIGGGTTDVAIFRDGSIWHTAVLPVAGYQLTRDVAMGLGLPFDVAEDMKKRYASVMPVYEGKRANPGRDAAGRAWRFLPGFMRYRPRPDRRNRAPGYAGIHLQANARPEHGAGCPSERQRRAPRLPVIRTPLRLRAIVAVPSGLRRDL